MGATAVVSGCGECGGFGVGATASSGSVCRFADFPGFRLLGVLVSWYANFSAFRLVGMLANGVRSRGRSLVVMQGVLVGRWVQ